MLGLSWTEVLIIGIVALIFIGPRDLPVVMNRIGKIAGQIRRMGADFQREINKTTGLDEVRNLRNSITQPLKQTTEQIRREFNTITPTGQQPSGVLKPTDPKVESVVDAIKEKAGMAEPAPPKSANQIAAEAGFKPPVPAPVKSAASAPAVGKAAAKPRARKAPAKAAAAPTAKVETAELPAVTAKPARKPVRKAPATKPAEAAEAAPTPARQKRTAAAKPAEPAPAKPRKKPAAKAGDA